MYIYVLFCLLVKCDFAHPSCTRCAQAKGEVNHVIDINDSVLYINILWVN